MGCPEWREALAKGVQEPVTASGCGVGGTWVKRGHFWGAAPLVVSGSSVHAGVQAGGAALLLLR